MFDFTRNQFIFAGALILMIGIQLHNVEGYKLNEKSYKVVAKEMEKMEFPLVQPTIRPPEWVGYAVISTGAVLLLHALALKKPSG